MTETVKKNWSLGDIPSQIGKLAVVTGATGGLGYETALGLAQAGAEVILAGRNEAKGTDAVRRIVTIAPGAKVQFGMVDLTSLASVAVFADGLLAEGRPIDILVNNAAVMATPTRQITDNGFELQLGTNYLSHFALTAQLLPLLVRGGQTHVVQLSSLAHRQGKIHFDDLQLERGYTPWKAYTQSKLAMLIFAFELQKRSDANGWGLMSNAAHPGYARTDIIANGPGANSVQARLHRLIGPLFSHSSAAGALPTLYAATAPEARPRGYYGPDGFYEMKGPVAASFVAAAAKDGTVARRLWEVSEELTGVTWPQAEGKRERTVTVRAKV
jgi:NAD(P)-dependent dehydrogenase (short-subunit alcohol dehydrogenase family)